MSSRKRGGEGVTAAGGQAEEGEALGFAELCALSNFTFLTGASHPEEYVARASDLGLTALAIADRNTLAGVVRAHGAARALNQAAARRAAAALEGAPAAPDGVVLAPRERANVSGEDVRRRASALSGRREGESPVGSDPASTPASIGSEAQAAQSLAAGLDKDGERIDQDGERSGRDGRACRERDALAGDPAAPLFKPRRKLDASDRSSVTAEGPDLGPQTPPWAGRFLVASRLRLEDSALEWIALPRDRAAYGRLCRLLTIGKRRAVKGGCRLFREDLAAWGEGLLLLAAPPDPLAPASSSWAAAPLAPPPKRGAEPRAGVADEAPTAPASPQHAPLDQRPHDPPVQQDHASSRREAAQGAAEDVLAEEWRADLLWAAARFPGAVYLAARPGYDGRDRLRLGRYAALAAAAGAPMIATADPLMHAARRRRLADVLTCIREGVTVDQLGALALPNAERRLRSAAEMRQLFADHPEAVARTTQIAAACGFSLDELSYEYPDEAQTDPETGAPLDPQIRLERLAWEGLAARYPAERWPDGPPERVKAMCARELALIKKLGYARYFLTVRDTVAFAESRGIMAQGRGSAANSVVCYALRVTAVAPETASMVFERFVSEARNEPPDIDVDFEHERREEVIQHIYARYGRARAGLCAAVIHFRARAAIREVGKAMGLSEDALSAMASQIWGWGDDDVTAARLREIGLDPADRRLRITLQLVNEIIGFPRHLSQHVGGFIMTRGRLDELCPIENAAMEDRTVIEWDKDDIDALGILKVDVLSLGMLTCLRKGFELIERHHQKRYDLTSLPREAPEVYDMLGLGDSIGVFQVESRAQMNFLPRMRPRCFYDLVIQVAIVRPGPIQGDMVHPYLRRRQGKEPVSFPSGELEEVLGKTLGVPLFQEQAMRIAIVAAGFTPEEADQLRRALATFRKSGTIHTFRERFVGGMTRRGYDPEFAARCFSQIEGFGEYGFPESHAASFALLVYASAWMKRFHPTVFACALLNAQPMGFYAPAQIVRDARAHGVAVRPVCVNASFWDNGMEPDPASAGGFALRLGFRQVKGLGEEEARWIAACRGNGYAQLEDLWRRAGLGAASLERLAEADAFAALGLSRRDALWAAKAAPGGAVGPRRRGGGAANPLPLFEGDLEGEGLREPPARLPPMSLGEAVVEDYLSLRLSLRAHPVALLRHRLTPSAALEAGFVAAASSGQPPSGQPPSSGPTSLSEGAASAAPCREVGRPLESAQGRAAPSCASALLPAAGQALPGAPVSAKSGAPSAAASRESGSGERRGGQSAENRSNSVMPSAAGDQGSGQAPPGPTMQDPPPPPPHCASAAALATARPGVRIAMAGLVIVRQRPGSAKGVIFLTLEDETGSANIVVWRHVYQRFRRAVIAGRLVKVTGRLQREGEGAHAVTHLVAEQVEDLSDELDGLSEAGAFEPALAHADEVRRPVLSRPKRLSLGAAAADAASDQAAGAPAPAKAPPRAMHPRDQAKRLFPSRDFH